MKLKLSLAFFLCFYAFVAMSQENEMQIDSSLARKITISNFCLCRTTFNDLKKLCNDLKQVEVEEMDLGKKCIATDSRYENGKGYYSEKYPGIIFQKDDQNYISKIRLTKEFIGKLPDGTSVNLNTLLLKDIIQIYPELNSKWGSRGCSDYWNFSNDTLAFFVKIDKNKQPQFPIDEKYYMDKPIEGIDLMISCYDLSHKTDEFALFPPDPPDEPLFFLDSIRVNRGVLKAYQPTEFAFISIYKDSNAIRIAGKDAKNGAVYLITKSFAKGHYWNYFKSKSKEYENLVPNIKAESKIVYILNNKVLTTNFEKELFDINDKSFLDLIIVNKDQLKKEYKISDKSLGVSIRTK